MAPSHPEPSTPPPVLSANLLRRVLDGLDTGVRVVDLRGNVLYANREAERLADVPAIVRHAQPLRDDQGHPFGVVEILRDPAATLALERENAALRREADTDPLTGIANRRRLDFELECQHALFQGDGTPYCLLHADIDHFKAINDASGHAAGDAALVGVARLLTEHCRPSDLVGRHGGDEFLILVPQITAENAASLADRLRAAIASAPPDSLGGTRLTISLGIAEAHAGERLPQLLARADAALRQAKAEGRNRAVLAANPRAEPSR